MTEPESETRELQCALTEAELLERGDQMSKAELAIEKLKEKRKAITARITAQVERRLDLAQVIEARSEEREVRCVWIENFPQKCFDLVRQDTGEHIDQRTMRADDLQEDMFTEDDFEPDDVDQADESDDDPPVRKNLDTEPEHLDA